jgi:hypothetical protein
MSVAISVATRARMRAGRGVATSAAGSPRGPGDVDGSQALMRMARSSAAGPSRIRRMPVGSAWRTRA